MERGVILILQGVGNLAEALLRDHFDALKRGDYQALAKGLGLQIEEVLEVIEQIKRLEPKPGRPFGPEAARVIVPDVIIYKTGNDFEVALNDDGLPKLRINRHYRRMLEEGGEGVPVEYLKEKMRAAQWLIKSLEQRQQSCNLPLWETLQVNWLVVTLPAYSLNKKHNLRKKHRMLITSILQERDWLMNEQEIGGELIFFIKPKINICKLRYYNRN